MNEYKDLPIFKGAKEMPKAQKPRGPFICSKQIALNEEEIKLLSKDPKFSVLNKLSRIDFLLELERMNSKHRYKRGAYTDKKKEGEKVAVVESEVVKRRLLESGESSKLDPELERKKEVKRLWLESKDRYVFDPISKTINFDKKHATE